MTAAGLALIAGGLATLIGFRHLLWGGGGRRRPRPQRAIEPARRMALGATPHVPEDQPGEPRRARIPAPAHEPVEAQPVPAGDRAEPAERAPRGRRAGRRRAPAALAAGTVPEPRADTDAEPVGRRQGGLARIGLADDEEPSGEVQAPVAEAGEVPVGDADEVPVGAAGEPVDEAAVRPGAQAEDEPAVGEPAVGELAVGELVAGEPVASDEPASDELVAEKPAAEALAAEEPVAAQEPVAAEAPMAAETMVDEPGTGPEPLPGRSRAGYGAAELIPDRPRNDRYGDRVDGWVRPEYRDDDIDLSVSGEYWTPAPQPTYDDGAGYGWPVPVERLPAVPPQPPRSGFDTDLDLDVPVAEPAAVMPQWPPAQPSGRIELPRRWAARDRKEGDEDGERLPVIARRPSRSERRRAATDATELLPPVDDAVDGASRPERRPRPRPRPGQPERSTVYRSRHAADHD
jgi:hypothetical protein